MKEQKFVIAGKQVDQTRFCHQCYFHYKSNHECSDHELILPGLLYDGRRGGNTPINSFSDISFDGNFDEIKVISLPRNNIQEIENLEKFSNLEALLLRDNPIEVIGGLKGSYDLKCLDLSVSQISKISGLDTLSNLEILRITPKHNISIKEINGMDNLLKLKELTLYGSFFKADNLSHLHTLIKLDLSGNFDNLAFLEGLRGIEKLSIWNINEKRNYSFINDISRLSILNCIRELAIRGRFDSFRGIESLPHLEILSIGTPNVRSVTESDFPRSTTRISLGTENIKSIKLRGKLEHLEEFWLVRNNILDEVIIENLPIIRRISLSGSTISKLYIDNLPKLCTLNLAFSNLFDLIGLKELKNIRRLVLYGNNLNSIRGIEKFITLEDLDLLHNPLRSLEGIEYLENLRSLSVGNPELVDFFDIGELENLNDILLADISPRFPEDVFDIFFDMPGGNFFEPKNIEDLRYFCIFIKKWNLTNFLEYNPYQTEKWFIKSKIKQDHGELKEAAKIIETEIKYGENCSDLWKFLAVTRLLDGDGEGFLNAISNLIRNYGNDKDAIFFQSIPW